MSEHALLLYSFNLGALLLLFFIVGMIKPKWPLFFMEKPTRWLIMIIATIWFMVVMTMYGKGGQQVKLAEKHKKPVATSAVPVPAPEAVPVPVPDAVKEAPKSNSAAPVKK
jgi:hypothetical protein